MVIGAALSAVLLLAGCSAGGGSSEADAGGAPIPAPDGVSGFESSVDGSGSATDADQRSVIVTGTMTVTAESPSDAAAQAVQIVEEAGGRVEARSEYAPSGGDAGSATLTLRIPADQLQTVIDRLRDLGRTDDLSTQTTDVTTQVADLDARIATERAIIDRLNALFAQASTIDDLIQLETTIAQHQSDLESLEAQQRAVADQVALSRLDLFLRSESEAPAPQPLDFVTGLQTGWGAFVAFFGGLLVALGVLLPWIVTAGLLTAAVIVIVRWRRRRKAATPAE